MSDDDTPERCRYCRHSRRTHAPMGCWVLVNTTGRECGCREMKYEEEDEDAAEGAA